MTRFALIAAVVLVVALPAVAQTTQSTQPAPDVKSFELTPTPPPVPALKHELFYDVLADRIPGNAAILYLQTALLMGTETPQLAQDALAAYEANDLDKFNEIAAKMHRPAIFTNLDLAARREACDWQPPIRELGADTLLPHLQPLAHGVTRTIKVRALQQMENGKPEDAVATLRLGYELSDKVGREPTLVSGMVALAIATQMNDALARVMSRPNAPNLYWALSQLPTGRGIFRNSLHVERRFLIPSVRNLDRAIKGEDLTPQEWRTMLEYMASLHDPPLKKTDPVKAATPQNLEQARELYARRRGLKPEQVEKLDPVIVLGNFYVDQAAIASDDIFKLRNLPYPLLMRQARELKQRHAKLKQETPGTPFLPMLDLASAMVRFGVADRQRCVMVNVEALRSYAAANGGKLPTGLDDLMETPALENPLTGEPFEYTVKDGVATLSDSRSEIPLTYTIRIRQ
jgi:hypothetical protein